MSIRVFLAAALFIQAHFDLAQAASYPSYPPSSYDGMLYFEDSENKALAERCLALPEVERSKGVCARAYFLPRGIRLAKTRRGKPMVSQALHFNRTSTWLGKVVYNLTLEPDYAVGPELNPRAKASLATKYSVPEESVLLEPLPISKVQFLVRETFGSGSGNPSTLPTFSSAVVPNWSGDFHHLSSRFSVTIQGPIWDYEPGLMHMLLNEAENGAVGQVSFGFTVQATPIEMKLTCNAAGFKAKAKELLKVIRNTRISSVSLSDAEVTEEEQNVIRASVEVTEYCDVSEYNDTTVPEFDAIRERKHLLFTKLFKEVFKKAESTGPSATVSINLQDTQAFTLNTDLDFYAGGVTRDNLDPHSKYVCQPFAKFDQRLDRCVVVCEPQLEVYAPKHKRADRRGCVDVTQESLIERKIRP